MRTLSIRWIVMLGLLGVVRPRRPHPPLRRSRQAVLDILCNIYFENLLTRPCPSRASRTASDENTAGQSPSRYPAGQR